MTGTELAIPKPTEIEVGKWYDYMHSGIIKQIKVRKIMTDVNGNIAIMFVRKADRGILKGMVEVTEVVSGSAFKANVVKGGLPKIEL